MASMNTLTTPAHFRYAGVEFEMLTDAAGREVSADELQGDSEPTFARVTCSLRAPAMESPVGREIRVSWKGTSAGVRARGVDARVRAMGAGRFIASAEASDQQALADALTSCIVESEGGLVLHAAASRIDGRAVLFIGPSGAGKTTAAGLTRVPWFARDRVLIARAQDQWWAWSLAGGSDEPALLDRADERALPLAAIYRVRRADRHPDERMIVPIDRATATFAVRESVFGSAASETIRLENILGLVDSIPVAMAHTRMGEDLAPAIRAHLRAHRGSHSQQGQ